MNKVTLSILGPLAAIAFCGTAALLWMRTQHNPPPPHQPGPTARRGLSMEQGDVILWTRGLWDRGPVFVSPDIKPRWEGTQPRMLSLRHAAAEPSRTTGFGLVHADPYQSLTGPPGWFIETDENTALPLQLAIDVWEGDQLVLTEHASLEWTFVAAGARPRFEPNRDPETTQLIRDNLSLLLVAESPIDQAWALDATLANANRLAHVGVGVHLEFIRGDQTIAEAEFAMTGIDGQYSREAEVWSVPISGRAELVADALRRGDQGWSVRLTGSARQASRLWTWEYWDGALELPLTDVEILSVPNDQRDN